MSKSDQGYNAGLVHHHAKSPGRSDETQSLFINKLIEFWGVNQVIQLIVCRGLFRPILHKPEIAGCNIVKRIDAFTNPQQLFGELLFSNDICRKPLFPPVIGETSAAKPGFPYRPSGCQWILLPDKQ